MRTSGDCKIGNPQNNLTGDCLIANWTPCTRTTKAHSFLLLAYQLKISWLSKDDNYVLERASTMSYASGVTPTPILSASASASACLTWAKPWKSVRISESLCGFQDKIKLGPKQQVYIHCHNIRFLHSLEFDYNQASLLSTDQSICCNLLIAVRMEPTDKYSHRHLCYPT